MEQQVPKSNFRSKLPRFTLHLLVISVIIIGVMRLSYNESAMPDPAPSHGICSKLCSSERPILQDVYILGGTAVESAVTAPVGM